RHKIIRFIERQAPLHGIAYLWPGVDDRATIRQRRAVIIPASVVIAVHITMISSPSWNTLERYLKMKVAVIHLHGIEGRSPKHSVLRESCGRDTPGSGTAVLSEARPCFEMKKENAQQNQPTQFRSEAASVSIRRRSSDAQLPSAATRQERPARNH